MKESLRKSITTHGLVILSFFIINLLIHYPALINGKSISQHDILQSRGGNEQLKNYRAATGEEALWNPYLFSGMPAYLTGVKYSGDLMQFVYRALGLWMGHPTSILFVAMVSFYIMLLCFKVRPIIAALGAISFALNGFNVIGIMAGHNAKVAAVALMPLVVAGVQLTFSGKKWLGVALTALALGLEIRANHPQITYYLVLIITGLGINELVKAVRNKKMQTFGTTSILLILAATLAVGANYGRLATTLEYSKYSIRGKSELVSDQASSDGLDKEYAFRYSNGITEPLFLFVPNIFGGSSQQALSAKSEVAKALKNAGYNRSQVAQQIKSIPTYWGDQPLTAPYFAGTLAILFFILGILLLPKNEKFWIITLVILGIVMSWGKNFESFNDLLFNYLPGYNKFRSVTFTIIISLFGINLLGCLGLEKLFSSEWNKETIKKLLISFGIGGGFLLLLIVFAGAMSYRGAIDAQLPDWFADAVQSDRKSLVIKDALRALFFVGMFGLIGWLHFKQKAKMTFLLIGLGLVVLVDNLSLTKRFLGAEKFVNSPVKEHFRLSEADKVLKDATTTGDRVLNLQNPFNENRTSYYHASIGGYHGAKIRRYQDLIDYRLGAEVQQAIQKLQSQSSDFSDLHIANMLNARYFYAGQQKNGVIPNPAANGEAWVVSDVIAVNSADEEITKTCEINTKTQAVIDQTKFELPSSKGGGQIQLQEKSPNKLTYTASIQNGSALGVFSEIYYSDGWTATMNGNKVDILRANYVLRALEIPEGDHEIIFEFKPSVYELGNTIMLIGTLTILIGFSIAVFFELKNKNVVS